MHAHTHVCVIVRGRKMLKEIIGHLWSIYYVLRRVLKHFAFIVLFNPLSNIKRERKVLYLLHHLSVESLAQGPLAGKGWCWDHLHVRLVGLVGILLTCAWQAFPDSPFVLQGHAAPPPQALRHHIVIVCVPLRLPD